MAQSEPGGYVPFPNAPANEPPLRRRNPSPGSVEGPGSYRRPNLVEYPDSDQDELTDNGAGKSGKIPKETLNYRHFNNNSQCPKGVIKGQSRSDREMGSGKKGSSRIIGLSPEGDSGEDRSNRKTGNGDADGSNEDLDM